MHRNRWLLLVLALVAVLTLGAAGCGGDDDDEAAGGDTGATGTGEPAAEQTLRIAWGAEPPSLDPGKATDTTSSNVILAIMDPLVRLNPDTLEPVPSAADSWDVAGGNVVTFHLNEDAKWTNGDPVTAQDYVYSWKRTLSPELAADYAYQLYGIKGAAEYNGCEKNCDALADKVAVTAVDDYTLQVELTSPQPWFLGQVSHHSFLPVHQATVEEFGDNWTDPENIVTDGPFMLESWDHEAEIDLVKNPDYRDAENVTLERIEGPIIVDGIDPRPGVRGRRGRRARRQRTSDRGDRPAEGRAVLRGVSLAWDVLLRLQRREHRRGSAEGDGRWRSTGGSSPTRSIARAGSRPRA